MNLALMSAVGAQAGLSQKQPDEIDDLVFWMDATHPSLDGADYMWDYDASTPSPYDEVTVTTDGTRAVRWTARAGSSLPTCRIYWSSGVGSPFWHDAGGENDMPYLDFDGYSQYFASQAPYVNEGTFVLAVTPTSTSGTKYFFKNMHLVGTAQYNLQPIGADLKTTWGMDDGIYMEDVMETNFSVFAGTFDGSNPPVFRKNGGAPLAYAAHSASVDATDSPLFGTPAVAAGSSYLGYGTSSAFNMYHLFAYSRVLTNDELDQLGMWLEATYDVTQAPVTS